MPRFIESAQLAFQQGSSDKVYNAQVNDLDDGTFSVTFQYGRRGSSLTAGTKGSGLTEAKARSTFQSIVNQKLAKGYVPVGGSTAAEIYSAMPDAERISGVMPQLLNTVDEAGLELRITDDNYIFQEKKDGKRIMIRKDATGTVAINRKGLIVSIPQAIIDEVNRIPRPIILDGELIGETLYVFDVASYGTEGTSDLGFGRRLAGLLRIAASLNWPADMPFVKSSVTAPVVFVPGYQDEASKRMLVERVRENGGEGVVGKDSRAFYTPGRPNSGGPQIKFKFTATATCLVGAQSGAKRSVTLFVRDAAAGGMKRIGNVTILPNFEVPIPDQLVEVRYLHCFPNGSLYQPIYLGPRDDQDNADTYQSLKFKQNNGADEDDE